MTQEKKRPYCGSGQTRLAYAVHTDPVLDGGRPKRSSPGANCSSATKTGERRTGHLGQALTKGHDTLIGRTSRKIPKPPAQTHASNQSSNQSHHRRNPPPLDGAKSGMPSSGRTACPPILGCIGSMGVSMSRVCSLGRLSGPPLWAASRYQTTRATAANRPPGYWKRRMPYCPQSTCYPLQPATTVIIFPRQMAGK